MPYQRFSPFWPLTQKECSIFLPLTSYLSLKGTGTSASFVIYSRLINVSCPCSVSWKSLRSCRKESRGKFSLSSLLPTLAPPPQPESSLAKRTQRIPHNELGFRTLSSVFLSIPNQSCSEKWSDYSNQRHFWKENSKDTLGIWSAYLHCMKAIYKSLFKSA